MSTTHYTLTVEGHLDRPYWSQWFSGMEIVLTDDGNTVISGPVADQSALHGLLAKVRDLGLPLVALQRGECETSSGS